MTRRIGAMVLGLLLAGWATTASAQRGDEGAENFVRAVYASYSTEDDAHPPSLPGLDSVWSDRMSALIQRDQELATEDLPYLDADPICNCQDWETLTVQSVGLVQDPRGQIATVAFTRAGEATTVALLLSGDPISGWRIDDVLNPGYPSLADELAASNARIEAGGKALYRD